MNLPSIARKIYRTVFRTDPIAIHTKRGLVVGKNFNILKGVFIDQSHTWHITIGDDVTLGPRVMILAHDASTKIHLGRTKVGKVTIGNRVFVGANSTILPGVTIGDDIVIGAGSIVTRDLPSGHVYAGNPAKPICSMETFLERKQNEIDNAPFFDESYTVSGGITPEMMQEMNQKMTDRIGYIP